MNRPKTPLPFCRMHTNAREKARHSAARERRAESRAMVAEQFVYPGQGCWSEHGRDLIATLKQQGVTEGIVRGWVATIPDDTEGWCVPQFSRPGLAKLWNAILRHYCRVRDIDNQLVA